MSLTFSFFRFPCGDSRASDENENTQLQLWLLKLDYLVLFRIPLFAVFTFSPLLYVSLGGIANLEQRQKYNTAPKTKTKLQN